MNEKWKDIPGYKGKYQASDKGNIRSLDRINHRGRKFKGQVLKNIISEVGYYVVNLHDERGKRTYKVHQLVAMAFLGHVPCGYEIIVDHIDNDPLNNNLDNLQLISQRENSTKDRKGNNPYPGVSWYKRTSKWASKIVASGKQYHLGYFDCPLKAYEAYKNKLKELV